MQFVRENTDEKVCLKLRPAKGELTQLKQAGLIKLAPRCFNQITKQSPMGKCMSVYVNKRHVVLQNMSHGMYEINLPRSALFLMDCHNHAFLVQVRNCVTRFFNQSILPVSDPLSDVILIRRHRKVHNGIVAKGKLTVADQTAAMFEPRAIFIHKPVKSRNSSTSEQLLQSELDNTCFGRKVPTICDTKSKKTNLGKSTNHVDSNRILALLNKFGK